MGVWVLVWSMSPVQIVLCANNIYSENNMADVVTHELIHAFDHCRAEVDLKNPIHLACTEVRAWARLCRRHG